MRKALAVALLCGGVLAGYRLLLPPVSAQPAEFPFSVGASVRLTVHDFPSGVSTIPCKVTGVLNEFIGCEGDGRQRPPRFINLRFVQEITPTSER